jgi:hypothetical protein
MVYMKSSYQLFFLNSTLHNMELHKLDFWTSHQFYLVNQSSPFRTDSDDFWTTQASTDKLAVEEEILGVGTECYGPVKGDLQVSDIEPGEQDFSDYDHVVEGSLELKSGVLQVFPCTGNVPVLELSLPPEHIG